MNEPLVRVAIRLDRKLLNDTIWCRLLNDTIGRNWFAWPGWLFERPPVCFMAGVTVPVIIRLEDLDRLVARDRSIPADRLLDGDIPELLGGTRSDGRIEYCRRIVHVEKLTSAGVGKWRWLAYQRWPKADGQAYFPWEPGFDSGPTLPQPFLI